MVTASASVLLRDVRLVPVAGPSAPQGSPTGEHPPAPPAPGPVDVRITGGRITEVGPHLSRRAGEEELDGAGRWAAPGLWDHHVHLGQWARTFDRLDLTDAASAAEVLRRVRERLTGARTPLVGFGFRDAAWPDAPDQAALDAVAGDAAVVLASGDFHSGWFSARARELLGVPEAADGDALVRENAWFAALGRLADLPGDEPVSYGRALAEAAARGVVGVTEMEWAANAFEWPDRVADGADTLRVRTATYADGLDDVLAVALRTGEAVPGGRGLVRMGPLKIISDGSLTTATAHCLAPYPDPIDPGHPHGVQNVPADELRDLLRRARRGGLDVAVHAIGDAAVSIALDAFAATGARGSIEHAQLLTPAHSAEMARLGVVASVQPAHLLDDRDVTEERWPDRAGRTFVLRELLDAGVRLTLGSDAPVSPLDPWLAMAAAVHRSADSREPWHPEQHITPAEALAASTDGQGTLAVGGRGDVVLLDTDPLAPAASTDEAAARLRRTRVAATLVGGRVTHLAL
ncbi:amidohydrolase [Georgenia muralis]|uniref:Amidohydrolase 3 domain-containing protein n=1 Tax=Georgenia muralis TaxID=154117 RepID=A0A3N4ZZF9_9MICO|nr:amidohydrolase family protein [Georgenia muralis]RPF26455.1 hypothetical protein EDD32_0896 [Georgenia muralis]